MQPRTNNLPKKNSPQNQESHFRKNNQKENTVNEKSRPETDRPRPFSLFRCHNKHMLSHPFSPHMRWESQLPEYIPRVSCFAAFAGRFQHAPNLVCPKFPMSSWVIVLSNTLVSSPVSSASQAERCLLSCLPVLVHCHARHHDRILEG